MAELQICKGLRKLEFIPARRDGDESCQARIEFTREAPLAPGDRVEISLGLREGKLRTLAGIPMLLEEQTAAAARGEYVYRLSGLITEHPT